VTLVIALVVLLGVAALSIDIGRLAIATQHAQNVADAAALGAASELLDQEAAAQMATSLVEANNAVSPRATVAFDPSGGDLTFWAPGSTISGYGEIGPRTHAVRVRTHRDVPYLFAKIFGLDVASITREAIAVRTPPKGVIFAPMWVDYTTEYRYGEEQTLSIADGPHTGVPGNFGWLNPITGSDDFIALLSGYNVPSEIVEANYKCVGDTVGAYTGQSGGLAKQALVENSEGTARLQRATWPPFDTDTFESYHANNPRILLVPLAEYIGGTGSNAQYRIKAFGAFWITTASFTGTNSEFTGRFIRYAVPSMGGDPISEIDEPVYAVSLVM